MPSFDYRFGCFCVMRRNDADVRCHNVRRGIFWTRVPRSLQELSKLEFWKPQLKTPSPLRDFSAYTCASENLPLQWSLGQWSVKKQEMVECDSTPWELKGLSVLLWFYTFSNDCCFWVPGGCPGLETLLTMFAGGFWHFLLKKSLPLFIRSAGFHLDFGFLDAIHVQWYFGRNNFFKNCLICLMGKKKLFVPIYFKSNVYLKF